VGAAASQVDAAGLGEAWIREGAAPWLALRVIDEEEER